MDALRSKFTQVWGYEDFRPPQGEIAQAIYEGHDALIVMPTGAGKSVCFQLPALMNEGVTLVVSPLVALMENQVEELLDKNLAAATLHSELGKKERWQTLRSLQQNRLRLLYLSPETLLNKPVWEVLLNPSIKINALVLDEAHCLTQWGDSFRPTYRRLGAVRKALLACRPEGTQIAIAAFTATADPATQQTLCAVLGLQNPQIVKLNPYRSNLHISIKTVWTPKGRRQAMLNFIRQQGKQSGLVYARSRRGTEALAKWLSAQGYRVRAYHGGLAAVERRRIESGWIDGRYQFVVCTSAFGMGINKSDCRFVVHYEVPGLLSEYVQEIGRGGRDKKVAEVLALVSEPTGLIAPEDRQRWKFFEQKARQLELSAQQLIKHIPAKGHVDDVRRKVREGEQALALLHRNGLLEWTDPFNYQLIQQSATKEQKHTATVTQMKRYLFSRRCRWQILLEAFGFEEEAAGMKCGNCDRCSRN